MFLEMNSMGLENEGDLFQDAAFVKELLGTIEADPDNEEIKVLFFCIRQIKVIW